MFNLQLLYLLCRTEDKFAALIWILREIVKPREPTIIFAATRHHVEFLHSMLEAAGLNVTCVYGAMDQVHMNFCCVYHLLSSLASMLSVE